jgi:hypothetical protein
MAYGPILSGETPPWFIVGARVRPIRKRLKYRGIVGEIREIVQGPLNHKPRYAKILFPDGKIVEYAWECLEEVK